MAALLLRSLWGNKADLSLSCGTPLEQETAEGSAAGSATADLLADERAAILDAVARGAALSAKGVDDSGDSAKGVGKRRGAVVALVLDNCGPEVVSDLFLADGLLRSLTHRVSRVVLLVKAHPVFVSDVTLGAVDDVSATLAWVHEHGGAAIAARLRAHLDAGSLRVEAHEFYTSPQPHWDMPDDLRELLGGCDVALYKGDANYRRLLGDRHWPFDTPFGAVASYFPVRTTVAALRTLKSEVLVGVAAEVQAAAEEALPKAWLTSGRFGVIQVAGAKRDGAS